MKKFALLAVVCVVSIAAYAAPADSDYVQELKARTALVQAISSLAWPLLVLMIVFLFFPQVKKMLHQGNLSVKVGTMELTIEQAATQLTKNVLDLERKMMDVQCKMDEAGGKAISVLPLAKKTDWRILWVTENHSSHAFEIAYLEKDKVDVIMAHTTKEALDILKEQSDSIDAIITGVSRKENQIGNPKAGLELVRKVEALGYPIEVFVMCSPSNIKQYYDQLIAAGAREATSSPLELLSFLKGAGLNCPLQQKERAGLNGPGHAEL